MVYMAGKKREDGRNARTVANTKASEKKYDQIKIYVEKGQRDVVRAYAAQHGKSINGLINCLLAAEIPAFLPVGLDGMDQPGNDPGPAPWWETGENGIGFN